MIIVPIRTVSGLNAREHWRKRTRRVRDERWMTMAYIGRAQIGRPRIPCTVRLTRLGPSSGLDDDNCVGALKAVRDTVAKWLGIDDKHTDQVRYIYAQKRTKIWGVGIEFGDPMSVETFKMFRMPK